MAAVRFHDFFTATGSLRHLSEDAIHSECGRTGAIRGLPRPAPSPHDPGNVDLCLPCLLAARRRAGVESDWDRTMRIILRTH